MGLSDGQNQFPSRHQQLHIIKMPPKQQREWSTSAEKAEKGTKKTNVPCLLTKKPKKTKKLQRRPKSISPFPNLRFEGDDDAEEEGTTETSEAAATQLARQHTQADQAVKTQSFQTPAPGATAPRWSPKKQSTPKMQPWLPPCLIWACMQCFSIYLCVIDQSCDRVDITENTWQWTKQALKNQPTSWFEPPQSLSIAQ